MRTSRATVSFCRITVQVSVGQSCHLSAASVLSIREHEEGPMVPASKAAEVFEASVARRVPPACVTGQSSEFGRRIVPHFHLCRQEVLQTPVGLFAIEAPFRFMNRAARWAETPPYADQVVWKLLNHGPLIVFRDIDPVTNLDYEDASSCDKRRQIPEEPKVVFIASRHSDGVVHQYGSGEGFSPGEDFGQIRKRASDECSVL